MRTLTKIIASLFIVCCAFTQATAQKKHIDFKAKNFPPSKKLEFTKAFAAYKEGEKQFKLLKERKTTDVAPVMANFQTAYAFNPDHIALNRYITELLLMQGKAGEVFPYLENLYDMKAELSSDEYFTLASLLQIRGSFTRAQLIFKKLSELYGTGDFWAEGRLQSPEKRMEECETGEAVGAWPVRFAQGKDFVAAAPLSADKVFYNHFYGWWAFADNQPYALSNRKKNLPAVNGIPADARLYADLNGLVFLACNDSVITQVAGGRRLELDKLAGAHCREPFLSADLRLLYFSSDRTGGFGGYDIWIARFDGNGKLLSVKNAGPGVNDKYDQFAPSLSADGTRFFVASNGRGTTGGFDILYGPNKNDSVEQVKNLGFPVNSGYDEKEIIWDITGTKGFVKRVTYGKTAFVPIRETGSAREALFVGTGFSSANIGPLSSVKYEAGVSESFINHVCKLTITVQKNENVATEIEIFNLTDGSTFLRENLPDTVTVLSYLLPSQNTYGIHINGQGLVPATEYLGATPEEVFYEKKLQMVLKPIKKGTSFVLHNIFFSKDYNSMDPRSEFEIGRVAQWLKQHPKVKVEVAVHTDSLSMHSVVIAAGESAAFEIYEMLKQHYGIEKRRLDWMFYGPEKPIYVGKNMAESAKNRRIELIITDK